MHCELVVPALLASREIPRLPAVELLIARGRATHSDAGSLEEWLAEGFAIEEQPLAAGALTKHAESEEADSDICWSRADPVHLRLGADQSMLVPSAGFEITQVEADRFVASLNEHFAPGASFIAPGPAEWCVRTDARSDIARVAPVELAGQAADSHLPGPREAAFLNEIQMVLHEHPANEEREARGAPAVNSVWLWGAGKLPSSAEGPWHSMSANDPLAAGIAKLAGVRARRLPAGASEWLERAPDAGRHLVILDRLRGALALGGLEAHAERVRELEAAWFVPLLHALRESRIGMVTVHVPEAGTSWETIRSDLRRFWRRAKPLGARA